MRKNDSVPGNSFRTLYFCAQEPDFPGNIQKLKRLESIFEKDDTAKIILGLNAEEQSQLKLNGWDFKTEADFEHNPYLSDVNQAAIDLAASWYEDSRISSSLTEKGINFGSLVQHPMTYFLLGILRKIALAGSLLQDPVPQRVFVLSAEKNEEFFETGRSTAKILESWLKISRPSAPPSPAGKSWKKKILPLFWKAVSSVIKKIQPTGSRKILISSDLKHAAPVMPHFLKSKNSLIHLRDQYGIRQFPDFIKNKIPFYVPEASPEIFAGPWEARWQKIDAILNRNNIFSFRDISFYAFMANAFKEKFLPYFAEAQSRIASFEGLLSQFDIRGILTDEDVCPFNKTLIAVANQREIPSVVIQHGAPFWIVPIALAPVSCSKIAAWGMDSKKLLEEWGVPEHKIAVTGVPRYDSFSRETSAGLRQKVCRDLGVDESKKIIVLATDPFHEAERADFVGNYLRQEDLRAIVKMTVEAVGDFEDAHLIIKLHPRDRYESYTHAWVLETGAGKRVTVTRTYSTPSLVRVCDLLITVCSTVAIEALLCRKPVITINNQPQARDLQPHAEKGVALKAVDLASLKENIRLCLTDKNTLQRLEKNREKTLFDYLDAQDGQASLRVAALLEELMTTQSPQKMCLN